LAATAARARPGPMLAANSAALAPSASSRTPPSGRRMLIMFSAPICGTATPVSRDVRRKPPPHAQIHARAVRGRQAGAPHSGSRARPAQLRHRAHGDAHRALARAALCRRAAPPTHTCAPQHAGAPGSRVTPRRPGSPQHAGAPGSRVTRVVEAASAAA
jgi:hypothetical protein